MAHEHALERFGLRDGAREAVEDEAVLHGTPLDEVLLHDADDDVVGHQLAGVHVGLHLGTDGRAVLDRGAEDIAGGQVLDAETLGEHRGLRALPRARLAEQDDTRTYLHVRRGSPRSSAS
jgi:hypothetical protein